MRRLLFSSILLVLVLSQSSASAAAPGHTPATFNAAMSIHLSSATGRTIVIKNAGQENAPLHSTGSEIPHLVLSRNGVLTPGFERTLDVSIDNLPVSSSGIYVQLVIETQHEDPDLDRKSSARIRVATPKQFISTEELIRSGGTAQFEVTFARLTELTHKTIKTPTDYYRCRIMISDTRGDVLDAFTQEYAFLMENQWRVPLPKVLETTPGAAPKELVIYYYDMMPFQSDLRNPDTRIPREDVSRYIQTELVPAMTEAFRVESNVWGFPWHETWRSYRSEDDPKTLSVALGASGIWFHGQPAALGHAMISIRVDGTAGEYNSLTDGILSTFYHELFHNLQRDLSLHYSNSTALAGKDAAWKSFVEGTAVLASAVGQPDIQFQAGAAPRGYLKRANAFLGTEGANGGGLNKPYRDIPYDTALYWRFLYEQCGGIQDGRDDPATGMAVIRNTLETLYKGEVVNINSSTDIAGSFPRILDTAIRATPSCAFHSYDESLRQFARAIYQLRFANGRCGDTQELSTCGLQDPSSLYPAPPAESYSIAAKRGITIHGAIPSSYGIDLIELALDPSIRGRPLKLVFNSTGISDLRFRVEMWRVRQTGSQTDHPLASADGPVSMQTENGTLSIDIEDWTSHSDSLGLIITRLDPYEDMDAAGEYLIQISAQ